jgi:hypothetical protein
MLLEETVTPITLLPADTVLPHERLLDLLRNRQQWEDRMVEGVMKNPLESLISLLVSSSAAFYLAEHNTNPRVKTFWDALYFITTCASVGYANVFATTPAGKLIASAVFTFGPALCSAAFERDSVVKAERSASDNGPVVAHLQAILTELQRRGEPTA